MDKEKAEKEEDICKDCAEYGSDFCDECLEEYKNRSESETKTS